MFSKVFCYYGKKDLENISTILNKEKNPITIICETEESQKILLKNQYNVKLLDELFPIYSDKIFEVYENTKTAILEYEKIFKKLKFMEYSIDIGLLHYIQNDLLLIEKIKIILKDENNYIFIFKKLKNVNFIIQKIAKLSNFENNEKIYLFKNGREQQIDQNDSLTELEKINKISKYKNAFSLYSSNITKNEKNKITSLSKIAKKTIFTILKLSKTKIYEQNPINAIKSVLDQAQNKILLENSGQYGFFLSSDRKDLLEIYYDIFQKKIDNRIPFKIFTIDPITESFLDLEKFPGIDFFEESYILASLLKKIPQAKNLETKIISNAKTNNLFLLYNKKLNVEVVNGIYRAIAITMILESCLKKMQLKKIIVIEGTILGMIVTNLGKKLKIPSCSIETLIVDKNAISSTLYKADKICIYGTQGYETLLNYGINKNRIEITGNPKYDYIKKLDTLNSKFILEKEFNINSKSKIILIAMSRWHKEDEKWISNFIQFANRNNFEIIIKLHPRYKTKSNENQNRIEFIKNQCKNEKFLITFDIDLNLLMSSTDIIISDYSNIGVEGVLLGKPVINVNFTKEDLKNAQNYHKLNAVLYTEKYECLEKIVEEIIKENKYVEELRRNQKHMINKYNSNNDGKATERIFKIIIED